MVFCKKPGAMQVLKCKMQCGQVWWCFARNLVQCRCPANARVECQIIYTLANARSNLVTFLLGKFWIVRGPKIDIDPTESKSVLKKPSSLLFTENDTAWYGSCNMVEEATGREMSRWLSNLSTDATFPAAAVAVADAAAAATRAAAAVADDAAADADAPPVLFCSVLPKGWNGFCLSSFSHRSAFQNRYHPKDHQQWSHQNIRTKRIKKRPSCPTPADANQGDEDNNHNVIRLTKMSIGQIIPERSW